jgi:chaperonin GroES
MNLEALYNAVVVKELESQETTYGSIIVPDMENDTNKVVEVVAVGTGHYSLTGDLIPTQLKPGDIVVLPTMGFTRFQHEGNEYFVGKENEILAKIGSSTSIEEILEQTEPFENE